MSKVSRRFNIMLIFSVALSVLFSSMSITVYLLIRSEQDTHEKDQIHILGLADNIASFLDHAVTLNYQLSINPEVKSTIISAADDWEQRVSDYSRYEKNGHPFLRDNQNQYDFVELFFVQDKLGNQSARSYGNIGRRANRWWFQTMAVNQDYRSFLSHSYYSLTGNKPVASIFHPIMDQGSFIGIMGMDINFTTLQNLVDSFLILDDLYAIVTDMEGVVIAHPDQKIISEIYNLKSMTHSVIKDENSALNSDGYRELIESPIDWPDEIAQAVTLAISGQSGFFEDVLFSDGAHNVYYAPVQLSGSVNQDANYTVLLIHDRTPLLRTRNTIFAYILIFVFSIIFILYYLFHGRFKKTILKPLEILIDSMKNLDFDHFKEIQLHTNDEFSLLSGTYNELRQKLLEANTELKSKVGFLRESESSYKAFAEIGLALSTERNVERLVELILEEAQSLTHADGGTLYLYDKEKNELVFSILINETMNSRMGGTSGNPVNLPPVPLEKDGKPNTTNVSSCAAISEKVINIPNVYETGEFDFSGVQTYDRINNYHSRSMLVIPMMNMSGELIGVIQLINARHKDSNTVKPFSDFVETLIVSLASQAAVALTNMQLNKDLEALFNAFLRSIAAAVDEKSAFTGGHIRRVVSLTMLLAEGINRDDSGFYADQKFSREELEEMRLAAWMHDIGKVTTPESLMDKRTKLQGMQDRMEIIEYRYKMICSMGSSENMDCDPESLKEELDFLYKCNESGEFLDDESLERLKSISERTYEFHDEIQPFLTEDELYNLSIRKGNLNPEEREQIEHHAEMTRRILNELTFPPHLSRVGDYASMHHEKLDGSGYPLGLKADQIPLQARIITIADIFEALTAKDRPYRQPMKLSKAIMILKYMVKDGHLDNEVLELFIRSGALSRYAADELNPDQVDLDLPNPAPKLAEDALN